MDATGCLIDEYAVERAKRFGKLGLQAATLAGRLRETYSIPDIERGEWNPVEHIQRYFRQQEEFARKRAEEYARNPPPPPVSGA
jgi:hypothetical protein